MTNYLREHPGIVAAGFFVALIITFLVIRSQPPDQTGREQPVPLEGEQPPPSVKSARLEALNKIKYRDQLKALADAEEIIATTTDPKEKEAARALLPELLDLAFYRQLRDKQFPEARQLQKRMLAEFPKDFHTAGVRMTWGRALGEQLGEAAAAKDTAKVDALFEEYRSGGYYLPRKDPKGRWVSGDPQVLEMHARFQLERWKSLPPDERARDSARAAAARGFEVLLEHNNQWHLLGLLEQPPIVSGEELAALADAFDRQTRTAAAYVALAGANRSLRSGRHWHANEKTPTDYRAREELSLKQERRLGELAAALMNRIQSDPAGLLCALTRDQFAEAAILQIGAAPARTLVLREQMRLSIEEYLADTAPLLGYNLQDVAADALPHARKTALSEQLHAARNQTRRIAVELRRALFDNLCRDTAADLWTALPPATLSAVERALPANTPLNRLDGIKRDTLQRLVSEGRAPNPVETSPAFEERRLEVAALSGVYDLGGQRESAFRDLRVALRESPDTKLKAEVRQAVQQAFRLSHRQGKFDALIELAGFYGAEFGGELARDPFRNELRTALESGAGRLKSDQKMKYVFVQALLASIFAGEEIGRKAQQETVDRAFEAVAHVQPNRDFSASSPSGIAGFSSVAVDNSTEHHILLVYDGPEKFAVLCNPLRKGSFLLKNGAYRIAVMTPLGDIVPYRAERTLTDEHAPSEYRIRRTGGRQDYWQSSVEAYGDYTLLRALDAGAHVRLNPRTGVFRSGGPL